MDPKIGRIKEPRHNCQTIEYINVTGLKSSKRHAVFVDCMNRNGFIGFVKHKQNNQTYYIFIYETLETIKADIKNQTEGKTVQHRR